MPIGKIYDSDEATRIQNQLNAINKPIEDIAKTKNELTKKITIGICIFTGIVILAVGGSYVFKKR
jgi:tetrahydromethanopterin S-methyltransferase subunit G